MTINETWKHIFDALGTVRCLRAVTLPSCKGEILELLLMSCKQLTSITATELRSPLGPAM